MFDKSKLLKIGALAKPHGVTGEMLVRLSPEWLGYEPDPDFLFIDLMGGLVPFEIHSIRYKNDQDLIVTLDTINTEDRARRIQGAEVYIDPEEIGEEPEGADYSIHQLVGMDVSDKTYGHLGQITAVEDIQNNPLISILHKGREILIPIHKRFIVEVDLKKRKMSIDAPPGLIDLYME